MSLREPKPVTVKPSPPDKSVELLHTHGEEQVWQHHDPTWENQVAKCTAVPEGRGGQRQRERRRLL